MLYGVVQAELESFLADAQARERPVPRFVERELRAFLSCGVLAHGFVRVRCDACARERLVAFACKGRGFCPSCGGRRMADTAAHLVDRVIPWEPVRQWVLSLPFALRYRLAWDARLASEVLGCFLGSVFASLRRRARLGVGHRQALQCGAVTFVQRFGDALNLNVHFHALVLDGVYARDESGAARFHPLPPPDGDDVARVAGRIARRIVRLLERRGLHPQADSEGADTLTDRQPLLAALYAASVSGRVATGSRAGRRLLRVGDRIDPEALPQLEGERCASVDGVSLHANVAVPARDRRRLERLCRYVARPPVATDRLSRLADGRLLYRLKHRWRDGTSHIVFEPRELLEKLAALVPPPRFHLARYHGVLGPCASARARVVPMAQEAALSPALATRTAHAHCRSADRGGGSGSRQPAAGDRAELAAPSAAPADTELRAPDSAREPPPCRNLARPRRLAWAELMRRVFALDVLECPGCGGRMRILAAIHPPEAAQAILGCLGLPERAPPIAPARIAEGDTEAASFDAPPDDLDW
ncbi:MAG TPA: transposase [Myxococcota bacterium]|nr:transposase [Myxococcota bacterium]